MHIIKSLCLNLNGTETGIFKVKVLNWPDVGNANRDWRSAPDS